METDPDWPMIRLSVACPWRTPQRVFQNSHGAGAPHCLFVDNRHDSRQTRQRCLTPRSLRQREMYAMTMSLGDDGDLAFVSFPSSFSSFSPYGVREPVSVLVPASAVLGIPKRPEMPELRGLQSLERDRNRPSEFPMHLTQWKIRNISCLYRLKNKNEWMMGELKKICKTQYHD